MPNESAQMDIYRAKLKAVIQREEQFEDSLWQAYSLMYGQCTELLKSKLHQYREWHTIEDNQDIIALSVSLWQIIFMYDGETFTLLALINTKATLYNLQQGNMTNEEYLKKFKALVEVATSFEAQI